MLSENAVVTVLSFLKVLEMRRCDTSIFVEVVGIGVGCLSHIDVSQGRSLVAPTRSAGPAAATQTGECPFEE